MSHGRIPPWQALAHAGLDGLELTDLDWCLLDADPGYSLRIEQRPPNDTWRYLGYLAGRGSGKSFALSRLITKEVVEGRVKSLALMAQDEERTITLQVEYLIAAAPLWCKCRMFSDQLVWDNGATAQLFTPHSPGMIRGFNGDLAWISELVAWPHGTRQEAFANLLTATRTGGARMVWDTTSKGRNELITYLLNLNATDADKYPVIRGTIFDNPLFTRDYLREQCQLYSGRRREEELLGMVFTESEGAIFEQAWIDIARVNSPGQVHVKIVGLDPGISVREGVDGTGLVIASSTGTSDYHVWADRGGVLTPEQYANVVLDEYETGAAGVVLETNRGGSTITSVIRAVAQHRKVEVRVLEPKQTFPKRTPGVLYVREVHSRGSKLSRSSGPSALYKQGRVHHIGLLPELENEMCTYDGDGESPNRLDALNMALIELAGLNSDKPTPEARQRQASEVTRVNEALKTSWAIRSRTRSVL